MTFEPPNLYVVPSPDYTASKAAAQALCSRLEDYYKRRNIEGVKAWLEPRPILNTDGERISTHYDVRSNLKFVVPKTIH